MCMLQIWATRALVIALGTVVLGMEEPHWTKNKDQRASTQDDERHARKLQHQPDLKGAWGETSGQRAWQQFIAERSLGEGDKSLTTQDAFIQGQGAKHGPEPKRQLESRRGLSASATESTQDAKVFHWYQLLNKHGRVCG